MSETRICPHCNVEYELSLDYFHKDKNRKSGFNSWCKNCVKEHTKKYRENNKEKIRISKQKYNKNNKEKVKERSKKYAKKNKEKIAKYQKQYELQNKEKLQEQNKMYYQKNKDRLREDQKSYRERNKEHIKDWRKKYYLTHHEECVKKLALYRNKNRELIRIKDRIRYENNKEKIKQRVKNYAQTEKGRLITLKTKHNRNARIKKLISTLTIKEWDECIKYFNNSCAYCGKVTFLSQEHVIPVSEGGNYVKQNIVPACKSCNSSKNNSGMYAWFKKQRFFNEKRLKKIYQWIKVKNDMQQLSIL